MGTSVAPAITSGITIRAAARETEGLGGVTGIGGSLEEAVCGGGGGGVQGVGVNWGTELGLDEESDVAAAVAAAEDSQQHPMAARQCLNMVRIAG